MISTKSQRGFSFAHFCQCAVATGFAPLTHSCGQQVRLCNVGVRAYLNTDQRETTENGEIRNYLKPILHAWTPSTITPNNQIYATWS